MKKRKRTYKRLTGFLVTVFLLIISITIIKNIFINKNNSINVNKLSNSVGKLVTKEINESGDNYSINIKYPFTSKDNIDNKINEFINNLINKSKNEVMNSLDINYDIYNIDKYNYIVFNISSSIDDDMIYQSYLIDKDNINNYSNIFDLEKLKEKVLELANKKYSTTIVDNINKLDFNNLNYLINNSEIIIYFYELKTSKISYVPYIKISKKNLKNILKVEYNIDKKYKFKEIIKDKYIALTFDDGPSDNTNAILDVLKEYNAHVTFFSLGNRMKSYKKVINRELREGHLVASHSYSHKDLSSINSESLYNEINSTNIAFNSITGKNITLLRPPYGNYNNRVLNAANVPLILWNIDTKDWYTLDGTKTGNTVIKKAFNGGIALMHDLYASNIEALKIMLPELEAKGYNFVTVEELADNFNVKLKKGEAYRYIE